jgi:hypothetical protein
MAKTPKTSTSREKPVAERSASKRKSTAAAGVPQRKAEAHDDGLLESLGKAVSEPVRDAADPEADEKPG